MTSLTELSTILSGQSRAEIVTHIVISPPVYVGPGLVKVECGHSVTSSLSPLPLPVSIICIDWPQLSSTTTTTTTSATTKQPHPCQGLPGQYLLLCVINSVTTFSISVQYPQHDNVTHSAVELLRTV